jgi:hypothetical protein
MAIPQRGLLPHPLPGALAAALWFEPTIGQMEALKALLANEVAPSPQGRVPSPTRWSPAETLLRQAVFVAPAPVRSYFAVCALEAWRRVPVRQLADWSGISFPILKHRLATTGLTPAGVAAWNFALHATWLLDVAELPASAVVSCMGLGRPAALGAILGARGVSFFSGQVRPGAFSATLKRYLEVLRAAFKA